MGSPERSIAAHRGGDWPATIAATAASTHALEAAATACGVALVASGALTRLGQVAV